LKKNKMMQKTALITGATSGIGMATATKFAEAGFKLIITGRREARLKKLAEKLSELSDVITLNFDVRDKKKVFEMLGNLPSAYQNIDILINNAGNAHGLGAINQGDIKDWEAMLDINVKGLYM
jgi:NADP-dependent 3-hydroxy acid dehydrogenase YdfG